MKEFLDSSAVRVGTLAAIVIFVATVVRHETKWQMHIESELREISRAVKADRFTLSDMERWTYETQQQNKDWKPAKPYHRKD